MRLGGAGGVIVYKTETGFWRKCKCGGTESNAKTAQFRPLVVHGSVAAVYLAFKQKGSRVWYDKLCSPEGIQYVRTGWTGRAYPDLFQGSSAFYTFGFRQTVRINQGGGRN